MRKTSFHTIPLLSMLVLAMAFALPLSAQKNKGKPKSQTSAPAPQQADPDKAKKQLDWLYMEACTQLLQENDDEAKSNFEKVLEMEPKHGASHYNLSCIYLRKGDLEQALTHARAALDSERDNYWYHVQLRTIQEKRLDFKAALATQEGIVARFPDERQARETLSQLYLRNERPDDALRVLTDLEARIGFDEPLVQRKYDLLMGLRRTNEALAEAEKLVRNRPGEIKYLQLQWELLWMLDRKDEAAKVLLQMQSLDPNNGFLLLTLADHYKSQGDTQKSDEFLFRAIQSNTLELPAKLQIITGLLPYISTDAAVKARVGKLARIVSADYPVDAQAQGIFGDILRMEGKRDSAMVQYRRSLTLEPANRSGWQQLLSLENDLGDWPQLKKDGEKALEYFPNEPALLQFFGTGCAKTGDREGAIYAFEKLRKMSSGNPEVTAFALLQLGQLYHDEQNFAKSDEAFTSLLQTQPTNAEAKNNYAYCLAERKTRLDEAEKMSLEALQSNPTAATYLDTQGWVLFQKGSYPEAAKWLEQAALAGGGAIIFEHFADVLVKMGDNGKASEFYQKAKAAGGDKARIDAKLKLIQ